MLVVPSCRLIHSELLQESCAERVSCLPAVEMEAPVNLSYVLVEAGGDEIGHNAQLSWMYPVPSDLQYGLITLQYELQYRRINEPDNWKVRSVVGRLLSAATHRLFGVTALRKQQSTNLGCLTDLYFF